MLWYAISIHDIMIWPMAVPGMHVCITYMIYVFIVFVLYTQTDRQSIRVAAPPLYLFVFLSSVCLCVYLPNTTRQHQ